MGVTAWRIPSTSWRYQIGKGSLSPNVKSTPYGSTDCTRLYAKSRAIVASAAWRRVAERKFNPNGSTATSAATASTRRGAARASRARPIPASIPHTWKLITKK